MTNIKRNYINLLFAIVISLCMGLLFSFPLRGLFKLLLAGLGVSNKFWGISLLIIVSGFISFIVAKVHQYIRGEGDNINLKEFVLIFTVNLATASFLIILGYSLAAILVSCVVSPIFAALIMPLIEEWKVRLEGDKLITGYLQADRQPEEIKNTTGPSNTEQGGGTSRVQDSGSKTESADIYGRVNINLRTQIAAMQRNNDEILPLYKGYSEGDFHNLLAKSDNFKFNDHPLWVLLKNQVNFNDVFNENRMGWILNIIHLKGPGVSPELIQAYADTEEKKNKLHLEFVAKVEEINPSGGFNSSLKTFFNLSNGYKNSVAKEVNVLEERLNKELRVDPIYKKNADFRLIINKEYRDVKKAYVDQDSYLRNKISEALNAASKP